MGYPTEAVEAVQVAAMALRSWPTCVTGTSVGDHARGGGDLDRVLRGLDELLLEARCLAYRLDQVERMKGVQRGGCGVEKGRNAPQRHAQYAAVCGRKGRRVATVIRHGGKDGPSPVARPRAVAVIVRPPVSLSVLPLGTTPGVVGARPTSAFDRRESAA